MIKNPLSLLLQQQREELQQVDELNIYKYNQSAQWVDKQMLMKFFVSTKKIKMFVTYWYKMKYEYILDVFHSYSALLSALSLSLFTQRLLQLFVIRTTTSWVLLLKMNKWIHYLYLCVVLIGCLVVHLDPNRDVHWLVVVSEGHSC